MLGLGKSESPMHCLYCDRPLALLKRLTGDGEFCSKEHRKQYHQEHNQLAVARLLEAQRAVKPSPLKKKDSAPPSAAKPGDRQPQLASFVPEYSREAKADSGSSRFTSDPRFVEFATFSVSAGAPSTQPRTAVFQSERIEPRSSPARLRALPVDARWQALQPALPERLAGRIAPVLGSPLRRPVRIASQGEAPALFEIRLRPVVFPAPPLVMASLSGRPHHTDRLGFTPP